MPAGSLYETYSFDGMKLAGVFRLPFFQIRYFEIDPDMIDSGYHEFPSEDSTGMVVAWSLLDDHLNSKFRCVPEIFQHIKSLRRILVSVRVKNLFRPSRKRFSRL